jgi:anti-anti-sigma factor
MSLQLHFSNLANGIMIRCEGRIVCGGATEELERRVRHLLPLVRHIVLELTQVSFVDSGGLGLLVRLMTSARHSGGDVKLAAPSPQVTKLLETTALARVFELFHSPEEALSFLAQGAGGAKGRRLLCVDPSCDVLAFMRTVLAPEYSVRTTDNLFDAKILLRSSRPDLIVLGPNLDTIRAQKTILQEAPGTPVLALTADFDHVEAGEAGTLLLQRVHEASGTSQALSE